MQLGEKEELRSSLPHGIESTSMPGAARENKWKNERSLHVAMELFCLDFRHAVTYDPSLCPCCRQPWLVLTALLCSAISAAPIKQLGEFQQSHLWGLHTLTLCLHSASQTTTLCYFPPSSQTCTTTGLNILRKALKKKAKKLPRR